MRPLVGSALCALVLAIAWTQPVAAGGESSQAAREFDRGAAAAARGDYQEAAAAFLRAYELMPHASALYNAGLAWQARGDRARAADAYAKALDLGQLPTGQANDARKRLETLQVSLGRLDITAPAGTKISVAHVERADPPVQVYVDPGVHKIRAWGADGRERTVEVTVSTTRMPVHVEPPPEITPIPTTSPALSAASSSPTHQPSQTPRTLGWIAVGTGAALGVTTIVLGSLALQARNEFSDSGNTSQAAHDRAASYRTWTNITLAATVVVGATGVVLLWRSPSSAPSTETANLQLRAGPGSLALQGRF